jgi:isopentenyldiphosphate isomerase
MMLKLLKQDWPEQKLKQVFQQLCIPPRERAEKLSLEQFVQLTEGWGRFRSSACKSADNPPLYSSGYKSMPEEIFDVVNERDEVVDRKPRREVHRLGLKHRAVHVLVFNLRGETFLQKRSMTKDREPGKWDSSSSGHVGSGEDYDACAVRELREEIGLTVAKAPERLFKIAACPETDAEFVWVYRCQAEGPFQLYPDEIERGGWFAPEKITRWIARKPGDFAGAFRLIWQTLNR